MRVEQSLWGETRMTMDESIQFTIDSMLAYGEKYRHWAIAYSGGKDSSATVTLIVHLIEAGLIPKPESLTVLYADTRMELPPLHMCAMNLLSNLESRGVHTKVGERKKDGMLSKSNMRMGPYTMEARSYGLAQVLAIQEEVNIAARLQDRPLIDLINEEEHARILHLQAENTWPQRWTGEEVRADELVTQIVAEGVMQDPLWFA